MLLLEFFSFLFQELRGELETCLIEGRTLLISDVDLTALENNDKLNALLRGRPAFIGANVPFKLTVCHSLSLYFIGDIGRRWLNPGGIP